MLCTFWIYSCFHWPSYSVYEYSEGYQCPEIVSRVPFNAKKNDIWCFGICLFSLVFGTAPWKSASVSDRHFCSVMGQNGASFGSLVPILRIWGRDCYAGSHLIELLIGFLQFERHRITIEQIKKSRWYLQWEVIKRNMMRTRDEKECSRFSLLWRDFECEYVTECVI